jgi:hypothetical protein
MVLLLYACPSCFRGHGSEHGECYQIPSVCLLILQNAGKAAGPRRAQVRATVGNCTLGDDHNLTWK